MKPSPAAATGMGPRKLLITDWIPLARGAADLGHITFS